MFGLQLPWHAPLCQVRAPNGMLCITFDAIRAKSPVRQLLRFPLALLYKNRAARLCLECLPQLSEWLAETCHARPTCMTKNMRRQSACNSLPTTLRMSVCTPSHHFKALSSAKHGQRSETASAEMQCGQVEMSCTPCLH